MLTAVEFLEQELNTYGYLNQVIIDKAKEELLNEYVTLSKS